MNRNQLMLAIQGCLQPQTVHQSEHLLKQYSEWPNYLSQLLQLIPNQPLNTLTMIMSSIHNYLLTRYNHPEHPVHNQQKQVLRSNLLNLFYQINGHQQTINLYKQIVYIVLAVDYQSHRELFDHLIKEDLTGSIVASTYVGRQLCKVYEWLNMEKRNPMQMFICDIWPHYENLMEKILENFNQETGKCLTQLLKMFYSAFHIQIPYYLREFGNIEKWLFFFKTIMMSPINDSPQNHCLVSRIYVKILSMYCLDGSDKKESKGWAAEFRKRYASNLYLQVVGYLIKGIQHEQTLSNIVKCVYQISKNPDLRLLIEQDHCNSLIYQYLLPYMEATAQEHELFMSDGLEYIRREDDLTCYPLRRMALDMLKSIVVNLHFGNKSQIIKLVEHSANVLGKAGAQKEKEVIIVVLTHLSKQILKNQYLKQHFEQLIQQYFIPIISSDRPILIAQTCKLLHEYLEYIKLGTPVVKELMSLLYEKICSNLLVVKYNGILAFTSLLDDREALDSAKPHFQNILQIYVEVLNAIDHEKLLKSLQQIVRIFASQIVGVARDLSQHLFGVFHSLHTKEQEEEHNHGKDDDGEGCQASGALSTIKQILEAPLPQETYFAISENMMILLKKVCSDYDDYFEDIFTLFNVLVYKTDAIADYQFPYVLCRKLLEGNNQLLNNCNFQPETMEMLASAEKADEQYSESLLSILKNLIQKMPQQILYKYPYPTAPQLLLTLIENKKLRADQLSSLGNTPMDGQWRMILQSYTALVYGVGSVSDPEQLKLMSGVSLYPWVQTSLSVGVVKRVLLQSIEDEDDDLYDEEDTMQMLEKFANEDEDDVDDYYVSEGGNYTFLYNSPFDATKDPYHLATKLKQMPPEHLNSLIGQLVPKYRTKLEALLSS